MKQSEHKFPCLISGEFITLSKVMERDANFIFGLRTSDGAVYLNRPEGYSLQMQLAWQKSRTDEEVNYIIYDQARFKVGMVSIYDCDWSNGVSNVGRLLLSNKFIHKSTPYGLEALLLTYGYVFNTMGFRKIAGTINTRNEKVYALQKYLGMNEEGTFRDHVLLNGKPQNLHFLSLFREEFPEYSEMINKLLQKFRQ
jgi:RimJ/RimL family protein N-acetyltransferase